MRLVVTGARDWADRETIRCKLGEIARMVEVDLAHGGARGADTIAAEVARSLGMVVRKYTADWARHGNGAGMIRNRQMLDAEKPDLVLAFTDSLTRGDGREKRLTGTGDCVAAAVERGIRVQIVPSRRAT